MVEGIPASVQSTHIPGIWKQCDVPMLRGQTQEMARHFLNPQIGPKLRTQAELCKKP